MASMPTKLYEPIEFHTLKVLDQYTDYYASDDDDEYYGRGVSYDVYYGGTPDYHGGRLAHGFIQYRPLDQNGQNFGRFIKNAWRTIWGAVKPYARSGLNAVGK